MMPGKHGVIHYLSDELGSRPFLPFGAFRAEAAALFPREQYSFLQNSQDEIELKDLQEYLSLVSAMGES